MDQFNPPESNTMQTGNGQIQYNQGQQSNQNSNFPNQGIPNEMGQNFQPPVQNQPNQSYQQPNQSYQLQNVKIQNLNLKQMNLSLYQLVIILHLVI